MNQRLPVPRLRTTASTVCGLLLCASLAPAALGANSTAPSISQPLSLVQLTDLALSNNPATKLAWASVRSSEAGLELARSGYWPQLTASYSVDRIQPSSASGTTLPVERDSGPAIDLSYLLWDFGTRSGSTDAAKFNLTSAQLSQSQTMQDLILTVEQDYYQVLDLQGLAEADAESLKDATASLDAARQRKASGLATIGDVYQAEAAQAGAQLALQQTQGQLAVARGQLAVAVGYPADSALPLAPWDTKVTPQMPSQSIQQLLDEARNGRPELLASKAQQQAAFASLEAAQGRGLPTLGFDYTAARTRSVVAGQTSTANTYDASLTLSVPLFTGFANQAANRQAQAAVDAAQASDEQLMQTVELEVWQAYQNLNTSASTLDTTDTQLKSAQEAMDVTNARYKGGLGSILDVLSAQATLANARVQQVQARLNWFAALAAMGHAVGGLNAPQNSSELP
jgi:outer membrane protein